jgi:type IV secretion system protein VirB10
VVVLALIAVNGGFSSDEKPEERAPASSDAIGNRLGPAPELPEPPAPPEPTRSEPEQPEIIRTGQVAPPPAPSYPTNNRRQEDQPPTPQERKASSTLLAFGNVSRSGGGQGGQSGMSAEERARQMALQQTSGQGNGGSMMGGMGGDAERADGLGAALEPTQVEGARASLIADRNMFVTKGTFLDCALETAISSDVPGMTSCRLTRDVYSTSGKVLLLERGSRIVGQYKGGLQRGQARIFVLWNRIETPTGVVVNLDSPGTDALGRSGHSGYVDTHFWERFGGAIMLSLIDDVGTYVANEASDSGSGGNQIQFGGTAEAAKNASSIALENSINIPPTLVKHQGDHINVFVARDLDFRGVYDLKAD